MSIENTALASSTNGKGTTPSVTNDMIPGSATPRLAVVPSATDVFPAPIPSSLRLEVPGPEEPVQPEPSSVRRGAPTAQDAREAAAINDTRTLVGIIMGDAGLAPLKDKGFDTQNLTKALALCEAADEKFESRQVAMAAQLAKTSELHALFDEAVKCYADFRETARTIFPDEASLKALKVSDPVPDGLSNFLTEARSAYTTAKKAPYTTELAKKGFDVETLDGLMGGLDTLREAGEAQARLIGDALRATSDRRAAVESVRKFQSDLRRVARRVFRKQPGQFKKLEAA